MKIIKRNNYFINKTKKKKFDYLTECITTDYLIVGAGVTGALLAEKLSKLDKTVTIIDKNIVGYSSTSQSTAMIHSKIDPSYSELKSKVSTDLFNVYTNDAKDAKDDIDKIIKDYLLSCEQKQVDDVFYTEKDNKIEFENEHKIYNELVIDAELLENQKYSIDVNAKYSLLSKKTATIFNPYKFTNELLYELNKKENVNVFEHTKLESFNNNEAIISNDIKIKYNKIFITTGYETFQSFDKYITSYKTYNIITSTIESLDEELPMFISDNDPYYYIRSTIDKRLIIGGYDIFLKGIGSLTSDSILLDNLKKYTSKVLKEYEYKIEEESINVFINTLDNLPKLKVVDDNTFVFGAFTGSGIVSANTLAINIYNYLKNNDINIENYII